MSLKRTVVQDEVNWCRDCEVVEVPDWDGQQCIPCGCPRSSHALAEVIIQEGVPCAD